MCAFCHNRDYNKNYVDNKSPGWVLLTASAFDQSGYYVSVQKLVRSKDFSRPHR